MGKKTKQKKNVSVDQEAGPSKRNYESANETEITTRMQTRNGKANSNKDSLALPSTSSKSTSNNVAKKQKEQVQTQNSSRQNETNRAPVPLPHPVIIIQSRRNNDENPVAVR